MIFPARPDGPAAAPSVSGSLAITAGLLIIGGLLGILVGLKRRTPRAAVDAAESARRTVGPPHSTTSQVDAAGGAT